MPQVSLQHHKLCYFPTRSSRCLCSGVLHEFSLREVRALRGRVLHLRLNVFPMHTSLQNMQLIDLLSIMLRRRHSQLSNSNDESMWQTIQYYELLPQHLRRCLLQVCWLLQDLPEFHDYLHFLHLNKLLSHQRQDLRDFL